MIADEGNNGHERRGSLGRLEQLQADPALLAAVFDTVPAAVWFATDPDCKRITGNRYAARLLRIPVDENASFSADERSTHVRFQTFRDGAEVAVAELPMQRAARGEEVRDDELEVRFADGTSLAILIDGSPLRDASGKVVGAVCAAVDITARKRAEGSLREREAQFRTLADSIPQLAWMTDADGWIFWYNQRWYDYTGTTLEEMQGWGWRSVHHPDEVERVVARFSAALKSGEAWEDTFPLRGADGRYRSFLSRALPIRDDRGRIVRWFGTNTDITEQLATERELRDSRQRLELAVEATQLGVWEFDPVTRVVSGSERFGRMLAQPDNQPLSFEDWEALVHADDREATHAAFESALDVAGAGTFTAEYRVVSPNGEVRWFSAKGTAHFEGEGPARRAARFFGTMLDITDRKQTQGELELLVEQLATERLRYEAMVENIPAGIVLAEAPSGRVTYGNPQAEAILRHPLMESSIFAGSDRFVGYHTDGHRLKTHEWPLVRALRGERIRAEDILYQRGDGTRSWVRSSAAPIRDRTGRITSALVAIYDIDPEKRAEEHRTLLMNELNHRVKNTLATVQSIAAQTLRSGGISTELRETFERRLIALSSAHNVLTQQSWEGAELHDIVARALNFSEGDGAARFDISGPNIWLAPKAALALAMTFHELATNAAKYGALSNEEGRIKLTWAVANETGIERFLLSWSEHGGPRVAPPGKKGFGSRLIERGLAQELDGVVHVAYHPGGVVCSIDAPLAGLAGNRASDDQPRGAP